VWMWGVRRLAGFMQRRLPEHPTLQRLPALLKLSLACSETRLRRMGVLDRPLSELSAAHKSALLCEAYARKGSDSARRLLHVPPRGAKKRLTETYLDDPTLRAFMPPRVG
jgi:hypothetical protein